MVGEGFAGPVAGDEHAAAADAKGGLLVYAAFAVAGFEFGVCILRLHAVEEPVRAPVGAWGGLQFAPEPVVVVALRVADGGVAVCGGLGEVFGDVADGPF